jgi:DNA modification methylase
MSNLSKIVLGDCLDVMRKLPDCCVHNVITDPPYGLKFMGKKWDYDILGVNSLVMDIPE